MRTPLAWKNLTSSPRKCLLATVGVGFAVVLMFMQIGFRNALIDSNVQIFSLFEADVVMISKARRNVASEQRFDTSLLRVASGLAEVRDASAVYVERGAAQVQVVGQAPRPIRVIGLEAARRFLADSELDRRFQAAARRDAALVDTRSKPVYGFASRKELLRQQDIELNGQQLEVLGQFRLGTDFGNDGSLLMSARLLAEHFPWRNRSGNPLEICDLGLLRIQPSADPEYVAQAVQQLAPDQIIALPMQTIVRRERRFWATETPIGKIFLIGTIMGLVVGAIICYQIQFTDITDHMSEFATLKAMGYGARYFWSLILCQSIYLACLGFVPGTLVAFGLYGLLSEVSGLIMFMTLGRILLVWSLTVLMCVCSGVLAIRKLFGTDPASLF